MQFGCGGTVAQFGYSGTVAHAVIVLGTDAMLGLRSGQSGAVASDSGSKKLASFWGAKAACEQLIDVLGKRSGAAVLAFRRRAFLWLRAAPLSMSSSDTSMYTASWAPIDRGRTHAIAAPSLSLRLSVFDCF